MNKTIATGTNQQIIMTKKQFRENLHSRILKHLIDTNQGFCFVDGMGLVSREDCIEVLRDYAPTNK